MQNDSLGQILLRDTELTAEQLDEALRLQQTRRPRPELGTILLEKGFITSAQLYQALARQWDIPFLDDITPEQLQKKWINGFPLEFLKKNIILPIEVRPGQLALALADPLNIEAYDAASNRLGKYCPRVICPTAKIEQAISRCYYNTETIEQTKQTDEKFPPEASGININSSPREDLLNISHQAPIVKIVNTILFQAVNHRASDIHIEPYENEVKVRFRIDGVLHDVFTPPLHQVAALISRLKIMANLNIAERRLPQDGQSRIKIGPQEMDIRVSIIPTAGGERVVLRLLDKGHTQLTIDKIGFEPEVKAQFLNLINAPHGIILLTGPTGSGKTTTLYCAINELNSQERNILTVEDPIEYQLPGVGQMQVKPKIGLTFANCLRHILRQDPDVIMVGEIRDVETAEIAIQASLTGHLVLSTLHTNDSVSAIARLMDMGIEPYLISSSLIAVMAQRLLRVICPHCKTACKIENHGDLAAGMSANNSPAGTIPPAAPLTANEQFYVGKGCPQCLETGYFGRTGIFELLAIDEEIKEAINKQAPARQIRELALAKGMKTLRDDGLRHARQGLTTLEEVLRVTQDATYRTYSGLESNVGL